MATPFRRQEIPHTQARLKSLIKIRGSYGGYDPYTSGFQNPSLTEPLVLIGALEKVTVDVTRGAAERRELNYDTYGGIIEMVPGLVSFDVSFEYIWLYQASFMEACGFGGHTLEFQTRPMVFYLELPSPEGSGVPTKTIVLSDCWLKANPASFDVSSGAKDDLRMVQSVSVACGGILEVQ